MLNHTMWRLEQAQTRMRIQSSQTRFWLRQIVTAWGLCAVVVLFVALNTPVRKQYAGVWMLTSLPLKQVAYKGQRYDRKEMGAWLNEEVYQGSLTDWLLWAFSLATLPVVLFASGGVWWVRRKQEMAEHIRGAEVVTVKELRQRISKGGKPGITFAGVQIPQAYEQRHFLLCGSTGTGKTAAIRPMLRQIQARGEACIVVDIKGHLTSEFYNPARNDVLMNPLDARYAGWNLAAELSTPTDLHAFGASLFPVVPGMPMNAAYFHNTAQGIFRKALIDHPTNDPREIPPLLLEAGKKQRDVISTLQIGTSSFQYLTAGTGTGWSAKEWVEKNAGNWCFLTVRETDKDALIGNIALWIELLSRRLLSRPLSPPQPPIWLVIDELTAFRVLSKLEELLNRGREYGVSVILGMQSIAQLYGTYGRDEAVSMLSAPSTRFFLRANDGPTQAWVAEDLGEREVSRSKESETAGAENMRDSIHRSCESITEHAFLASQIGMLPDCCGLLKIAPYGITKVSFPYVGLVEKQPAFIPREEKPVEKPTAGRWVISKERKTL